MDDLKEVVDHLESTANLSRAIEDVDKAIDLLTSARDKITAAQDPQAAVVTLAQLNGPFKETLEGAKKDLLPIYQTLGRYSKALDKKFKEKPLPTAENDALSSKPSLINRAIAMHLLREGQFDVASKFVAEATKHPTAPEPTPGIPDPHDEGLTENSLGTDKFSPQQLRDHFETMYSVLARLKEHHDIRPAIEWAVHHRSELEARGSNLEFELCQLRFIALFNGCIQESSDTVGISEAPSRTPGDGPLRAWAYARSAFGRFMPRYARQIQMLMGAMSFSSNVGESPYRHQLLSESHWEAVAAAFTREYCSWLGLSADSPLYIAATAGAIALPTLLKVQGIMARKKTEWTTQHELPVEIPLPPSYYYHSIFVCPVSKEQSTDQNPPMMMPCGHVIAKESLEQLSKGSRFKCPYCPNESHQKDARRLIL
ncbi:uncharacterized protein EI97DRAFT_504497 [Westerdykella ornata]|uniref:GID complex catalytic subunit 2 n=1 Tax=Westerdykella ornata TaxID=318751 RepID=A0A6A6J662_WESOR|nr:uncharacterized protein EI97DRAFT_504497 [Westerdykella ornata]KAF2272070.1 hypothetical protein EI97DRAFT_504497 [Westerdykella ornata]